MGWKHGEAWGAVLQYKNVSPCVAFVCINKTDTVYVVKHATFKLESNV